MYGNITSRIVNNNKTSIFFQFWKRSKTRRKYICSLILLKLYLNGLLNFLIASNCQGLQNVLNMFEYFFQIVCYLKCRRHCTVSRISWRMQRQHDCFHTYCRKWQNWLEENRQSLCIIISWITAPGPFILRPWLLLFSYHLRQYRTIVNLEITQKFWWNQYV